MTVKLDGDIIMGEIAATADKRYLNPAYGSLEDMGLVFICICIYIRIFILHPKDMGDHRSSMISTLSLLS